MADTIIETKNLCKSFASDGVQNHVINMLDLQVKKGDFTVVMGASGSGKSTLLYCMSGMDEVTSGSVLYNGDDIASYDEKKLTKLRCGDFGFVFQQSHLVPNLTLRENIAVPGYLNKNTTAAQVDARTDELLEMLDLVESSRRLPSQVSGGQQQRCAIARAVINNPKLLFADEPTGALNRANTQSVLALFSQLNAAGQSIFMVTHDLKSALRGNRLIYLEDGRIVGMLDLPVYVDTDERKREERVNAWLTSLDW